MVTTCTACGHDDVATVPALVLRLRSALRLPAPLPRCGAHDDSTGDALGGGPCPCRAAAHRAPVADGGAEVPRQRRRSAFARVARPASRATPPISTPVRAPAP